MTRQVSDSGLHVVPATEAPQDRAGERVVRFTPRVVAPPPAPDETAPPLDREARRRIGRNLRLLYADILDQPLPDRFTALLDTLSSSTDSPEVP